MKLALTTLIVMNLVFLPFANAQDGSDDDAPGLPPVPAPRNSAAQTNDILDRIEELEDRLDGPKVDYSVHKIEVDLNGYVDIGFFAPIGNGGVGWVQDFGNAAFPEYTGRYGWVFLGDVLATSVNSRGEAADLGDAPGAQRFDSINSHGAPGFVVNEVNLRVSSELSDGLIVRSGINFAPRTGSEFGLGDFFDVDIAELEWVVAEGTSIFVGKSLPTFGIEYKVRKSNQRFGVTPSLVHRYTSGSQLGLKVRSQLANDWIILAGSVTNNSPTQEQFHFYSETDTNVGKTINGRAALKVPVGDLLAAALGHSLEIGLSGVLGSQDRAFDSADDMWFVGVDFEYRTPSLSVSGQWIRGGSAGNAEDGVWGLELNDSGYVEVNWLVLPYLGVLARGGLRDALVDLGTERAYLTKSWRVTGGLKAIVNPHVAIKAEYLYNGEFGGIAGFRNDVFTSSLVLSY